MREETAPGAGRAEAVVVVEVLAPLVALVPALESREVLAAAAVDAVVVVGRDAVDDDVVGGRVVDVGLDVPMTLVRLLVTDGVAPRAEVAAVLVDADPTRGFAGDCSRCQLHSGLSIQCRGNAP